MHATEINAEAKNFISERNRLQARLMENRKRWSELLNDIPKWIGEVVNDLDEVAVDLREGAVILTFGSSQGLNVGLSEPRLVLMRLPNGNVAVGHQHQAFYDPHDVTFSASCETVEHVPVEKLNRESVLDLVRRFIEAVSQNLKTLFDGR